MRRKLVVLLFALTATAAGLGLFTPQPAQAIHCNGFLVCCPDTNRCVCCSRPCPIQCP